MTTKVFGLTDNVQFATLNLKKYMKIGTLESQLPPMLIFKTILYSEYAILVPEEGVPKVSQLASATMDLFITIFATIARGDLRKNFLKYCIMKHGD